MTEDNKDAELKNEFEEKMKNANGWSKVEYR
jgi:hypothetical protein